MAWGEIVAGAISGLAGIGFQAYDNYQENKFNAAQEAIARQQLELAEKEYYSNVDIMNRNFGLQQQAFEYNKKQAELTRMREDNAFQRRVADTVAAGFSPLATEGVASSSQSPTLTAPQLDPQGVNQATTNRLSAYNLKMQQNNTSQQLRLQSQQLRLAQIETITETLSAVQNLRAQNIINQKNIHELDWYKEHGYRDTTLNTLLSDILKGVNINGKSLGQLGSDAVNFTLDKLINNPNSSKSIRDKSQSVVDFLSKKTSSKNNHSNSYNLTQEQIDGLLSNLSDARKGILSPIALEQLSLKLRKYFNTDFGIKSSRWKSLTQQEYEDILKQITERLR